MAINPPSDIVLDVARAADPLQYSAAVEKLARIGKSVGAADVNFDDFLAATEPAASLAEAAIAPFRGDLRSRLSTLFHPGAAPPEPYRQFEAFVLQNFIQSMLPKDATSVFGSGIAGDFWSSMLAEEIAKQLAAAGGIGIAASIEAKHPANDGSNPGPAAMAPRGAPESGSVVAFSTLPGIVSSLERSFLDGLKTDDDSVANVNAGLF